MTGLSSLGHLQILTLVTMASYSAVHPLYASLKAWACCDLGQQLFMQWVFISAGGKQFT